MGGFDQRRNYVHLHLSLHCLLLWRQRESSDNSFFFFYRCCVVCSAPMFLFFVLVLVIYICPNSKFPFSVCCRGLCLLVTCPTSACFDTRRRQCPEALSDVSVVG